MSRSTLKPVLALATTVAPLAAVLLAPTSVASAAEPFTEPFTSAAFEAGDSGPLAVWTPLRQQPNGTADAESLAAAGRTAVDADNQPQPAAKGAPIGAGLPDYPAHVFPSAEAGAIIGGLTGGAIGGITGVAFGMGVGCVAGLPFLIVGCPVGAILGGTIGFAIGTTVGSVAGVVLGASDGIARQLPPPPQAAVAASQDPVPQQVAFDSRITHDSAPIEKAGIDLAAIDAQIQAGVRQVGEALGIPSSAAG